VEIDESIFSHFTQKIEGGKKRKPVWVIGMIDTNTQEIRVSVIDNRNKESLNKEIVNNVKSGTKIITDAFDGYNDLNDLGYVHEILNKSEEGLGKGEKVTSHIESVWYQLKDFAGIYKRAVPPEQAQEYLIEFWLRREIRRHGLEMNNELGQII